MGPDVPVISVMFDGTITRQMLPAAIAVWACGWAPELGVTVYRRWIEWGDPNRGGVDSGPWR